MNRWIHKLNLSYWIGRWEQRKGGKRETKAQSKQPNNQSPWAQQGRAGPGGGSACGGGGRGRSSEARGAGGLRPLYIINLRSYGGILLRASIVTSARHTCV